MSLLLSPKTAFTVFVIGIGLNLLFSLGISSSFYNILKNKSLIYFILFEFDLFYLLNCKYKYKDIDIDIL